MHITKTANPDSTVTLEITIPWDVWGAHKAAALAELGKSVEIDGFRKGNAPAKLVEEKVPELTLMELMAERALNDVYAKALADEQVDAIGRPEVRFTKLGLGSDLEAKITTAVLPSFELPDYAKAAKEAKEEAVEDGSFETTEAELAGTIRELQEMRAHQKLHETGGHAHDDHSHGPIKDEDLPALDDEFAKSYGFDTLDAFREKVRENISLEKRQKAGERRRVALANAVADATEMAVPEMLVAGETAAMVHRIRHDVAQMGLSFEEYLKHLGKTEESMAEDFKIDAVKRIKTKLIFQRIAEKEGLNPKPAAVEAQVAAILAQHPDADKTHATSYVEELLTNEAVFKFLESK